MRHAIKQDTQRLYEMFGIRPIGGGSGESENDGTNDDGNEQNDSTAGSPPENKGGSEPIQFTPDQHKEVDRIVAKKLAEANAKRDQQAREAEEVAKRKAEQDQQLARGEFDQVKAAIETERDQVKAEAERIRSENERYAALATKRLESLKADLDLPAEVMKTYPTDAPILDQLDWLEDRAAIWEAARQANGGPKGAVVTATPKAAGSTQPDIDRITADMRSRISI
jgi:hypothetical protein